MKQVYVSAYTLIAGLIASSVLDVILFLIPLLVVMYLLHRPRTVDVYVLQPQDIELAEKFAEYLLAYDDEYTISRVLLVEPHLLSEEIDK